MPTTAVKTMVTTIFGLHTSTYAMTQWRTVGGPVSAVAALARNPVMRAGSDAPDMVGRAGALPSLRPPPGTLAAAHASVPAGTDRLDTSTDEHGTSVGATRSWSSA